MFSKLTMHSHLYCRMKTAKTIQNVSHDCTPFINLIWFITCLANIPHVLEMSALNPSLMVLRNRDLIFSLTQCSLYCTQRHTVFFSFLWSYFCHLFCPTENNVKGWISLSGQETLEQCISTCRRQLTGNKMPKIRLCFEHELNSLYMYLATRRSF